MPTAVVGKVPALEALDLKDLAIEALAFKALAFEAPGYGDAQGGSDGGKVRPNCERTIINTAAVLLLL